MQVKDFTEFPTSCTQEAAKNENFWIGTWQETSPNNHCWWNHWQDYAPSFLPTSAIKIILLTFIWHWQCGRQCIKYFAGIISFTSSTSSEKDSYYFPWRHPPPRERGSWDLNPIHSLSTSMKGGEKERGRRAGTVGGGNVSWVRTAGPKEWHPESPVV